MLVKVMLIGFIFMMSWVALNVIENTCNQNDEMNGVLQH